MLAVVSLIISIVAAIISLVAYLQARQTGSLAKRHEAINHVRMALTDVSQHGLVDEETSSNLREAYQISLLVFSRKVSSKLELLTKTAFLLQDKEFEQKTEKDLDAEHRLRDDLQIVLKAMQAEAALTKWWS
jgi:hypothetical protein